MRSSSVWQKSDGNAPRRGLVVVRTGSCLVVVRRRSLVVVRTGSCLVVVRRCGLVVVRTGKQRHRQPTTPAVQVSNSSVFPTRLPFLNITYV